MHYLWTYGPTFFLTVIGAAWARLEYQAKITAPWHRLAQSRPASAEQTLLVDYVEPIAPLVLLRSICHRDFQVAASTSIALLWSLLIAFSASLISLTPTELQEVAVPVTLSTVLRDSNSTLQGSHSLPYYNMLGLQERNLPFPEGVSDRYAYQTFSGPTISSDTELHTTVDAFSASLECKEAGFHLVDDEASWNPNGIPTLHYTMASSDCQVSSSLSGPEYLTNEIYFSRFASVKCGNSSDISDRRVAFLFGGITYGQVPDHSGLQTYATISANISRSVQLLCRPLYTISDVNVSKNGTAILAITETSPQNARTLPNVNAWDIMDAHIQAASNTLTAQYTDGYGGAMVNTETRNASDVQVDVDQFMYLVLGQFSQAPPSSATILSPEFLENATLTYYQQFAAFLAHHLLMEPAAVESTGSASSYQTRLIVNNTTGHVMTVILAIVIVGFLVLILMTWKKSILLPYAPSNIIGMAILMRYCDGIRRQLQNIGRADSETIKARLIGNNYLAHTGSNYSFQQGYVHIERLATDKSNGFEAKEKLISKPAKHPFPLHPWSRLGICVIIVSMIITLECLLQLSQRNNGVGDIPADESYIHYSWTTVPALLFTIVSLIYSSMDSCTRVLTPYANMSRGSSFSRTVGLDLMDLGVPRVLLRELRTANFGALAGTLTALFASLLATLSSSLFVSANIPTTTAVQLHSVLSLSNNTPNDTGYGLLVGLSGALVLDSNLSYPAFTYEDLVFPTLSLEFDNQQNHSLIVNATVPALRSKMECQLHNMSSLETRIEDSSTEADEKLLYVNITSPHCALPLSNSPGSIKVETPVSSDFVLAQGNNNDEGDDQGFFCYDWAYVWATLTPGTDPTIAFISALTCNESLEVVDVVASFLNAELQFDLNSPPRPLTGTARNTSVSPNVEKTLAYDYLPNTTSPGALSPFFDALTSSRYAIARADLMDASRAPVVRDAIVRQHGILRAQELNDDRRVPAERATAFASADGNDDDDDDAVAYPATVTDAAGAGPRRVVQDPAATRALEALLAVVLACSLAAWALGPRTRVLAAEPTSIAAVMALLADGNVYDLLPPGEEAVDLRRLGETLGALTFRMGWGSVVMPDDTTEKETKFGIFGTL